MCGLLRSLELAIPVYDTSYFGNFMHSITLAELASSFVGVVRGLLHQRLVPPHEAAQALWTLHRSRCDEWNYRLAAHRDAINRSGTSARTRKWHEVMPVLQEILLTEPLTRTLACFATQLEELQLSDEFTPLMHSNLVSHIEARHRCLNLIVFGPGLSVETVVKLNRLRRHLEIYADHLLAALPSVSNMEAYCFDSNVISNTQLSGKDLRSGELAEGKWLHLHMQNLEHQLWRNLQSDIDWRAANGRLNHRISQAVMALLPEQLFDGVGVPRLSRMAQQIRCDSPESDGKLLDPAACASPINFLYKQPFHSRTLKAPHPRKRW